ncbi:amidohydrolase [Formosa sp. L2A11]|uniref:amidohydrolase n=1 Tax=Formosa sp. L2A11 TaxID=2686363 RepID=UPI00131DFDFC|nr:amidohydrolase [Formosa sp. L2A11]
MNVINPEILNLRKELHENPELSSFEYETAIRIRQFVEKNSTATIIENIGGSGLAVVYEYPNPGKSITIRCELDALPIQEVNTFKHQSKKKGISHKCGHDGHMAIVSGLVFWLQNQIFNSGKIILLFQPAEETGEGAYHVLNDTKFKALKTDYIFALHNIPKEPLNSIIITEKGFSAEVQSFIVRVKGKESHAAEPENGINPALGLSEIITSISRLNVTNPIAENFTIITPVHITMGQKSYGISPAKGELHYTLRTWNSEEMLHSKTKIENLIKETCHSNTLKYEIEWLEYFPASINNKESNNYISKAALDNNYKTLKRPYPFKFGEDFGWFSKTYKTAMFGLGAGLDSPALHNTDYDFPDEIIETGLTMFQSIISNIMTDKN